VRGLTALRELVHYAGAGIKTLLGRASPLVAGVALTDVCNLQCKHCVVANAGLGHYPFERVEHWLRTLYGRGCRILYLQGGEPLSWRDGARGVDDVIRLARSIGYFRVAIPSNGTLPLESEADLMWVSVDGTEATHDEIRGPGVYARVMANVATSSHPRIMANMTVNSLNKGEVEAVVRDVAARPGFRGISINFHTPYPAVASLAVPRAERTGILALVAALKREGLPILNSRPALRAMATGKYARPVTLVNLVERDQVFECCWGRDEEGVCEECGYGFIAELSSVLAMRPGAMLQALRLFR
jgi:MoaA/NifB/PqqE/SkfB family radical SAM enzyme